MTTTPDDWSKLSKKVRYATFRDWGYSPMQAAQAAGFSGTPTKGAQQLADVLTGDDPTVEVNVGDKHEALDAYREVDQEIARLEWELAQKRRRKKAIRARLALIRDEHQED